MTDLDTRPITDDEAEGRRQSRKARRRKWLGFAGIYAILGFFAIAITSCVVFYSGFILHTHLGEY